MGALDDSRLPAIQARLLLNRHRIAAINLGPTGQPRTNVISTIASTGLDLFIIRQDHRAWTYYGHPFCQDEKTRLPAEMLRLDSRTICFLEFESPDFCNSFQPSSAMSQLRKAAFKSDSESSHWGRFPMGRFFASTSTHAQTQRCCETANPNKSRGLKASTSNTGEAATSRPQTRRGIIQNIERKIGRQPE